jgi:hypothetical protein
MRTDEWVVDKLAEKQPSEYFNVLATEIETAVRRIGRRVEESGHAFVAVGFARRSSIDPNLMPLSVHVSNALGGGYGAWQPRLAFEARKSSIQGLQFGLNAFGASPPLSLLQRYIDYIQRYRRRFPDRILGVLQLMVRLVREVSSRNDGVSPDVQIAVMPRTAVPADTITIGPIQEPVREVTCFFVPARHGVQQGRIYGPATVCPDLATYGLEFGTDDWIGPRPDPGPPWLRRK